MSLVKKIKGKCTKKFWERESIRFLITRSFSVSPIPIIGEIAMFVFFNKKVIEKYF